MGANGGMGDPSRIHPSTAASFHAPQWLLNTNLCPLQDAATNDWTPDFSWFFYCALARIEATVV